MKDYYRKHLAYIHDVGFDYYALKSAPGILKILQKNNIKEGLIVDLGCGSGLSAKEFTKAGYQVLGIDTSPAMIEIAKQKVPEAELICESFFKAKIPLCHAVTSVGECLKYLFDEDDNNQTLSSLFEYEPSEIINQLSQIGFQVETMGNYGKFELQPSQTVFIACKKI